MNNATPIHRRHFALALLLPLTLAACGGGESGPSAATSTSTNTGLTRTGVVTLPAGVPQAHVCLDLKGNGVCDAGSPMADTTPGGLFSISYQPKDAADAKAFETAGLLAEVRGDQGTYILSSPGGKSSRINSLTTLVYRQMLDSTTREAAEQRVAQLLKVGVDALYDPDSSSVTMAAASLTEFSLANGLPTLVRSGPEAHGKAAQLVAFNFKDRYNYEFDVHTPESGASTADQTLWRPVYGGKINGNDRTPLDAAYTVKRIDMFMSTGREEYVSNGVLKLFPAKNQFTPILLSRAETAEAAEAAQRRSDVGFALETTVENVDVSGRSIETFFRDAGSYRSQLKDIVHLNDFKVDDPSLLAGATFPQGSVLSIRLTTHIGNQNLGHVTTVRDSSDPSSQRQLQVRMLTIGNSLTNDLNPALQQQHIRGLAVKYSLNERAWDGIKTRLQLP